MSWLIILVVLLILCFGIVVFFGAPYLPTLTPQVKAALDLADLKKGQTLLELGSGDGKVLIAAAQAGYYVVGYEMNPILVLVSWIRTRKYRKNVKIIWGDYWSREWPDSQAIFVFLLPKYMQKLDTKIDQYGSKPLKLVSFAFKIQDKKISRQKDGVYLYNYK